MRIKNMKRFIISMTIILTFIIFLCSIITNKVFSHEEQKYKTITISSGDTLWAIASELNGNINENIYNIKKINNLEKSNLHVGQELLIPVM